MSPARRAKPLEATRHHGGRARDGAKRPPPGPPCSFTPGRASSRSWLPPQVARTSWAAGTSSLSKQAAAPLEVEVGVRQAVHGVDPMSRSETVSPFESRIAAGCRRLSRPAGIDSPTVRRAQRRCSSRRCRRHRQGGVSPRKIGSIPGCVARGHRLATCGITWLLPSFGERIGRRERGRQPRRTVWTALRLGRNQAASAVAPGHAHREP